MKTDGFRAWSGLDRHMEREKFVKLGRRGFGRMAFEVPATNAQRLRFSRERASDSYHIEARGMQGSPMRTMLIVWCRCLRGRTHNSEKRVDVPSGPDRIVLYQKNSRPAAQ